MYDLKAPLSSERLWGPEGIAGPGPSSLRHRASWAADSKYSRGQAGLGDVDVQSSYVGSSGEGGLSRLAGNKATRRARPGADEIESSGDDSELERSSKKVRRGKQRNLYGNLHVAGVRVPTMEAGMGLWFLFTVSQADVQRGALLTSTRTFACDTKECKSDLC
jgi:hypothetical protein